MGGTTARNVPSSGTVTACSDRTSSRKASKSSSALSTSSTKSTGGGASGVGRDGGQQRPAHQEPLGVKLVLDVGRYALARSRRPGLSRSQVEQLARIVPLVNGLGHVDPLIALDTQQLPPVQRGKHFGHFGFTYAGISLQEQGAAHGQGQVDHRGQPFVGQVAMLPRDLAHLFGAVGRDRVPGPRAVGPGLNTVGLPTGLTTQGQLDHRASYTTRERAHRAVLSACSPANVSSSARRVSTFTR